MELIPRDGGHVQLAVAADLGDQAADLVVLLDGLQQGLVGGVDAEVLGQGIQHMGLQLLAIVQIAVFGFLEGYVGEFAEEVGVLDDVHVLHGVQVLLHQVLLEPAGDGARLGGHLGIQEVEPALQGPLHQAAAEVTGPGGHVVGGHVRRAAAGGPQAHREAAREIQQNLRHEVAGVAQSPAALGLGLLDQIIVGLLQQILHKDQVFQVPHIISFLLTSFVPSCMARQITTKLYRIAKKMSMILYILYIIGQCVHNMTETGLWSGKVAPSGFDFSPLPC